MVGRSCSLDTRRGDESTDLRTALYEVKEDMQRLEEELDAEREASATSASEAMSVILRLQGEKAILAMEADQYKRMVEERMSLAEYSLDLLEDLNHQKDVQIKNLECELLAYRCKVGCSGIDDRSQTPSLEPIDIVPVEKGVIEESLDSTREKEKSLDQIKKFEELRDSIRDQYKTLKQETVSDTFVSKRMSKKSSKQKRERSDTRGSSSNDAELQRLKERVERLEKERCNKEIDQTSVIKQEANMNYDSAIVSVQEAMLYFWL